MYFLFAHCELMNAEPSSAVIGNWLEYRDMEAFKACDAIWQKNGEEFFKKYGELYVDVKFTSYRGQVFQDWS